MKVEYKKRGFIIPLLVIILGIILVIMGLPNFSPSEAKINEYYLPAYLLFFGYTLIFIGFLAMFLLMMRIVIFYKYAQRIVEIEQEKKEEEEEKEIVEVYEHE